jgi:hypothetical protein
MIKRKSITEKETVEEACDMHELHEHQHGEYCGHKAIKHGNHIDYLHDGHLHRIHGNHIDECEGGEAGEVNI